MADTSPASLPAQVSLSFTKQVMLLFVGFIIIGVVMIYLSMSQDTRKSASSGVTMDGQEKMQGLSVTASDITASSAVIYFNTQAPTSYTLEYGADKNELNRTVENPSETQLHKAELNHLENTKIYHFRIRVRSSDGVEQISPTYSFRTKNR